jgi:hypothetical protein
MSTFSGLERKTEKEKKRQRHDDKKVQSRSFLEVLEHVERGK